MTVSSADERGVIGAPHSPQKAVPAAWAVPHEGQFWVIVSFLEG